MKRIKKCLISPSKLHNATENATRKMLTELVESAITTKQQDKILMGDYVIEMERKDLASKYTKHTTTFPKMARLYIHLPHLKVQWQCLRAM